MSGDEKILEICNVSKYLWEKWEDSERFWKINF